MAVDLTARIARVQAYVDHPRTPEHERAVAVHMLARLKARAASSVAGNKWTDNRWYGERYIHDLKVGGVQIAKLLRDEIKTMRKVAAKTAEPGSVAVVDPIGDMPAEIKVSIRSDYNSIDITLKNVPADMWERKTNVNGYKHWVDGDRLYEIGKALRALMNSYNHEEVDGHREYRDVKFYGHVKAETPDWPYGQEIGHGHRW